MPWRTKSQLDSISESLLNDPSVVEFNEIADELKIQFDTVFGLVRRLERSFENFNTLFESKLFSMVDADVFADLVAASPHLSGLLKRCFDDEVMLRAKIRTILAMSSLNRPVDSNNQLEPPPSSSSPTDQHSPKDDSGASN